MTETFLADSSGGMNGWVGAMGGVGSVAALVEVGFGFGELILMLGFDKESIFSSLSSQKSEIKENTKKIKNWNLKTIWVWNPKPQTILKQWNPKTI